MQRIPALRHAAGGYAEDERGPRAHPAGPTLVETTHREESWVIDPDLRLPNTTFRAVFNLGGGADGAIPLPQGIPVPELDIEWIEEESTLGLYAEFDAGSLHLSLSAGDAWEHHFHRYDGEATETSLWPAAPTAAMLEWMLHLARRIHALMPELFYDVLDAAAWYDEGYPLYVCESEPARLDLIEVELEGEIMTLPWLGSGTVDHAHIDGDNHPIELLWNPHGLEPDTPIARAWLDPSSDEPVAVGLPGVDWAAVGISESDTAGWLEGIYLNHHVIADPADALLQAVPIRMAGLG